MPTPDPPDAYTVHQVPGRTRLRVPARRGDSAYFARVAHALALAPEVLSVRVNPSTGSILLHHSSPLQKLAEDAAEGRLFRLTAAPAARFRSARRIEPRLRIAPLSLLSAGFAGLAVIQFARARVVSTATEHLWAAYQASRILGKPSMVATLAAIGVVQLARGRVLSPAVSLLSYAVAARTFARRDAGHH
jgi:hypothetical protein